MPLPEAVGGGTRGSVVLTLSSVTTTMGFSGHRSHRFDLATGLWSRFSTNVLTDVAAVNYFSISTPSVFDAQTGRIYQLAMLAHGVIALPYLEVSTRTWKLAPRYDVYPATLGDMRTGFVHERLLVALDSTGILRIFQLDDFAAGPTTVALVGTPPSELMNRWERYPADGCYYTYINTKQNLSRLCAPTSPLTTP